jgi:hypothetical protein
MLADLDPDREGASARSRRVVHHGEDSLAGMLPTLSTRISRERELVEGWVKAQAAPPGKER